MNKEKQKAMINLVLEDKIDTRYLQRQLFIGYEKALLLANAMIEYGAVSAEGFVAKKQMERFIVPMLKLCETDFILMHYEKNMTVFQRVIDGAYSGALRLGRQHKDDFMERVREFVGDCELMILAASVAEIVKILMPDFGSLTMEELAEELGLPAVDEISAIVEIFKYFQCLWGATKFNNSEPIELNNPVKMSARNA
ncbi:MAG: hypothetical protein LBM01_04030 [Christensenellaceae bacterium]|jgi:hypothetical protein|nr:hypothetical protein [Christensenellaceae bacterium]